MYIVMYIKKEVNYSVSNLYALIIIILRFKYNVIMIKQLHLTAEHKLPQGMAQHL